MPLAESILSSPGGAKIIDGRRHARELRDTLRVKATELLAKYGAPPKLTVVLVGDDAASRLYVANKSKACRDVGIESVVVELPASTRWILCWRSSKRRIATLPCTVSWCSSPCPATCR